MRKILLLFGLLLTASFSSVFAQDSIRLGGQVIYGTNINTIGIGAIGEIPVYDKVVLSPSFSFYLPKKDGPLKTSMFELNGNLNYELVNENKVYVYAIGGLNFSSITSKVDYSNNSSTSPNASMLSMPSMSTMASVVGGNQVQTTDNRIGVNLGIGSNFDMGKSFLPFGEIKYILSGFDRLVIAAGVKFDL